VEPGGGGGAEGKVELVVLEGCGHDLTADDVWRARWWLRHRLGGFGGAPPEEPGGGGAGGQDGGTRRRPGGDEGE